MSASTKVIGAHDFDFLFGSWHIVNERLTSRLSNANEWERFEAFQDCRPILGGMGIQILSTPKGVISDRRAREEKVGGELLAVVY